MTSSHAVKERSSKPERSGELALQVSQSLPVRTLSATELLAAAAVAPAGSSDPVDAALAASLRANRPDLSVTTIPEGDFEPATPERKYSLARVNDFRIDDEPPRDVVIMRGDLESVLKESKGKRSDLKLMATNANVLQKRGSRSMGVAVAEVAPDGAVGDFMAEGLVGMKVVPKEDLHDTVRQNPSEWVRVRLWSGALRFQHWANLLLMIVMTVTGYYIMAPFFGPSTMDQSGSGFLMGWIRLAHFISAFAWILLGVWRVILVFQAKDRQSQWRSFWPLYNMTDVKNMFGTIQHYLFLKKEGPVYLGHNALQQFAYTGIYVLCIVQMLTGLALYGMVDQSNMFWVILSYPVHWLGIPMVRLIHAIIMYIIWAFVVIHVYLVFRADIMEGHGGLSSMLNGGMWVRRGTKPVDGPRIG